LPAPDQSLESLSERLVEGGTTTFTLVSWEVLRKGE